MRPSSNDARASSSHACRPVTSPHASCTSQTASSSKISKTCDTVHPCSPASSLTIGATKPSASQRTSSSFPPPTDDAMRIAVRTSAVFGALHPTSRDRSVSATIARPLGSAPSHPRTSAASRAAGSTSHANAPWSSAARSATFLASQPPPRGRARPEPASASGPSLGARGEREPETSAYSPPSSSSSSPSKAPASSGSAASSSRTCRNAPATAPTDHAPVPDSAAWSSSTLGNVRCGCAHLWLSANRPTQPPSGPSTPARPPAASAAARSALPFIALMPTSPSSHQCGAGSTAGRRRDASSTDHPRPHPGPGLRGRASSSTTSAASSTRSMEVYGELSPLVHAWMHQSRSPTFACSHSCVRTRLCASVA
mmetsp:Transcript_11702/g.49074  ORF Transcript_11702/g.49074 Transcript_11702/m.49074 type:complete len:369 (-) Transcript_11702:381-1487(-)